MSRNKRVCYFYDPDAGNYYYDQAPPGHPMKPHRVRMTDGLITAFDLNTKMKCLRPQRATAEEMCAYHSPAYVKFLQNATPPKPKRGRKPSKFIFNVGGESPIFKGLFDFCQISAGGSISAAKEINSGRADVAINWAGGMHHAKREKASGFCYISDIVLGIIELLKVYNRVMYIDIDIHHGDGVEEAFYTTNQVLTLSFHKFGNDYFPGTGDIEDIGIGAGFRYAVNVPLQDGIDDESYLSIFKPIVTNTIHWYCPKAIFLQCGADSLAGDRIGSFNLTIMGHAECVKFVKSFGLPVVVTGGGGYTVSNVARCWAYETAVLLNETIPDEIPFHEYSPCYGPDFSMTLNKSHIENLNTPESLNEVLEAVTESIRHLPGAPSFYLWDSNQSLNLAAFQEMSDASDDEDFDERLVGKYFSAQVENDIWVPGFVH